MFKIVHFGKYYIPDAGGIESVTSSLAQGAAKLGCDVTVICYQKNPHKLREYINGVSVIRARVLTSLASQPFGIRYILNCLSLAKSSNIVHLHAPNIVAAFCALFVPRRVRLLVHWHSDVVNKGILTWLVRPLEVALLRRADCIVATSPAYAATSNSLTRFQSKVIVVPVGVSDATYGSAKRLIFASLEEKINGRRIILSVGRLVPYKGFSVLIKSAKYLPADVVVVIVGGGELHQVLLDEVKVEGVQERVILAGHLSGADLCLLFQRASLYCLPSIHRAEAFGVVLLEAMSYGVPVVATEIPGSGVPWVNQHGTSGFNVQVGNPLAIARACNKILGSIELRGKLAKGARERYLSEFSEEMAVSRIMDIYKRLATD